MLKVLAFISYLALAAIFCFLVYTLIRYLKKQMSEKPKTILPDPPLAEKGETQIWTGPGCDGKEDKEGGNGNDEKCAVAVNILNDDQRIVSRIVIPNVDEICSISGSAHRFETDVETMQVDGVVERIHCYTLPPVAYTGEVSRHHIFFFKDEAGRCCYEVRLGSNRAWVYTDNEWEPAEQLGIYEMADGDRVKIGRQILEFTFVQPGIRNKQHISRINGSKDTPVTKDFVYAVKKSANFNNIIPNAEKLFAMFGDQT